jgi:YfiH family protein
MLIRQYGDKDMIFENTSNAQIDFSMEVPLLTFPVLSQIPFLKHGFSTRIGGVSDGMFSSMNLGRGNGPVKDAKENVIENYLRISKSIGVDFNSIVISQQVHKTNIRVVTDADRGKGLLFPRDYEEIDGLVTNQTGITLVTKYADCVPLYFVDTKKKAIGLTHSGWRGTVAEIGRCTVEELHRQYGSEPTDILAVIGPSICRDCFEIGEEVAIEFEKAFPGAYDLNILTRIGNSSKYLCDLWAANRQVLIKAGLREENIHISGVCTCCNDDILFSHRKSGGKRGSLAAFLAITEG